MLKKRTFKKFGTWEKYLKLKQERKQNKKNNKNNFIKKYFTKKLKKKILKYNIQQGKYCNFIKDCDGCPECKGIRAF